MFITQNDLHAKMRASDLNQIVAGNDTIIPHAVAYAEGKAKNILAKRYDVDKLFSAADNQREGLLVSLCCDVAIYEIVALAQPNIDLTDRRERAAAAVEYLGRLGDGEYVTAWPLREDVTAVDNPVVSGGKTPRSNYY